MLVFVPGIVPGLSHVVQALTEEGDKILVQQPVYYPFMLAVKNNNRTLVNSPLEMVEGQFQINLEKFKEKVKDCKLFIMSNPHNPGGRVWEKETLTEIAKICHENGTLVISDEIHADLTLPPNKHHVFPNVCEEARLNSVVLSSPSKAFNMAGLVTSYAVVENPEIREKLSQYIMDKMMGMGNVFAYQSVVAAYEEGEEWLAQMLEYVAGNIAYLEQFFKENMPKIKPMKPQASYLVFLDCRDLNKTQEELVDFFVDKAHLALNDGAMFGKEGLGFMRINLACPRLVVEKALSQLKAAYDEWA